MSVNVLAEDQESSLFADARSARVVLSWRPEGFRRRGAAFRPELRL